MRLNNYINLILCSLFLFSCNKNEKRIEVQQIVSEWTEKKIKFKFSNDVPCCVLGKDTTLALCSNLFLKEYKILLYVDSAGCSECRLKLFQWKHLIEEADSLFQGKLSFLFFFQPKDKKIMNYLFKKEHFNYPVFIDSYNEIDKLNHFPSQLAYQCFLLDQDNKVLMVGNPVLNPKIWELYKELISGKPNESKDVTTTVEVEKMQINLGKVKAGNRNPAVFTLKNTGNNPLIINRVSTSCGCTAASWEQQPVQPGETASIRLEITPEQPGYFNKTAEVFCNTPASPVVLSLSGTAE